MSTKDSDEDEADLKAGARAAGLDRALTRFPDDMRSAFHAAAGLRRSLGPDLQPTDEPWAPRMFSDSRD
jgi:hypothetical protein